MDKWCAKCLKECKQHRGELLACPSYQAAFPDFLLAFGVKYDLTPDQWRCVATIRRMCPKKEDFEWRMRRFLINEGLALED